MTIYSKTGSIYLINNTKNGKRYIGFTSKLNPEDRWTEHKNVSKNPTDKNRSALHKAMDKIGSDHFTFEVIYQSLDVGHALSVMEAYFIKEYDTFGSGGYNLTPGGDISPMFNRVHTDEARRKMSAARTGLKHKPETKEKMSASRKGKPRPASVIESLKSRVITEETREKLRGWQRGVPKSEETKAKIAATLTGKQQSQETVGKRVAKLVSTYSVIYPDGTVDQITNMRQFCRDNGLDDGCMSKVAKGKLPAHKGYRCTKL